MQAALAKGIEASAAHGGPQLTEVDAVKRLKAVGEPAAAARSWAAAEDTSDDDFE